MRAMSPCAATSVGAAINSRTHNGSVIATAMFLSRIPIGSLPALKAMAKSLECFLWPKVAIAVDYSLTPIRRSGARRSYTTGGAAVLADAQERNGRDGRPKGQDLFLRSRISA